MVGYEVGAPRFRGEGEAFLEPGHGACVCWWWRRAGEGEPGEGREEVEG